MNIHAAASEELHTHGVACVRQLVDVQTLREIEEQIDLYVAEVVPQLPQGMVIREPAPQGQGQVRSLVFMNAHSEFFRTLPSREPFATAISALVPWRAVPHYVEYFAKPPRIGAPLAAHQDAPSMHINSLDAAVLWLSLDFSSERNGGVQFFLDSHRLGVLPHNYALDGYLAVEDMHALSGTHLRCFDLAPGDATVHSCTVVHFSGRNESEYPRRGLALAYRSKGAKLDERSAFNQLGFAWPK